uniref:C2 domain-containing protein n=1 Tax=Panagrolaimus sp. JU765 TaxID=591449 RepID=A0AC34QYX4_9BILA
MEADELAVRRIRFRLYRFKSAVRPRQFRGECHLKTAEIDSRQPATHLLRFKMYPKLNANSRKKPHSPERTLSSPAELTPTMINRQGSVAVPGGPLGSATPSRRNSTVDSSGRFCALPTPNGQPEALISLCYLDQSEKIIVSVQKASNLDVEGSDTFVKVSVLSRYGEELAKHRSNSVKSASDTIFDCTAVFQVIFSANFGEHSRPFYDLQKNLPAFSNFGLGFEIYGQKKGKSVNFKDLLIPRVG